MRCIGELLKYEQAIILAWSSVAGGPLVQIEFP